MFDIQVVYPQAVLGVDSVEVLDGVYPFTLLVTGRDFTLTNEVRLNGEAAPKFAVMSDNLIMVEVPDTVTERVTSVTILSERIVVRDRSLLTFKLGKSPAKVSGVLRLMQLFLRILFTTPGTDIWSPDLGGGALLSIGKAMAGQDGTSLVQDLHIAVDQTARQVVALQARSRRIPLDERLLSASVTSIRFNAQEGALLPTIELLNHLGAPASATFST